MTEGQLRVLVAVVDAGGFSLAAERLDMSQPGVSRAIASLEAELGAQLLTRRRGAVTLTNVGVEVVRHARGVLSHAEAIRQHTGRESGAYAGRLRIGSLPSLSARVISPALGRLHAETPTLAVELFEATEDEVLFWLRNHLVDVGLVARPVPDVDITPLRDAELVAVVPEAHPATEVEAVPVSALDGDVFVEARSGFERLVADAFAADGHTPRVGFEVSDVSTAVTIVAAGLGVAVVPDLLLDDVPPGAAVLPLDPPYLVPIGLGVTSYEEALPAAAAFLAAARDPGD